MSPRTCSSEHQEAPRWRSRIRVWPCLFAAAKKKNDRIDANKICDCLRCDFLPECYLAPTAIRERRRTLRYRKKALLTRFSTAKTKLGLALPKAPFSIGFGTIRPTILYCALVNIFAGRIGAV